MSSPAPEGRGRRLSVGLLASSFCLLTLELTLSKIVSPLAGRHLVPLVLAPALLGSTVSGLAVYLAPRRFLRPEQTDGVGRALLGLALALLGLWAFFLLLAPAFLPPGAPYVHDPVASPDGGRILALTVLCLVSAVPFVTGGFVATLALSRHREAAAPFYAWNLAGAALGCLAGTALVSWLSPYAVLAALACVAALAAGVCRRGSDAWGGSLAAPALAALALALAVGTAQGWPAEAKPARGRHEAAPLLTRRSFSARVAVWPLTPDQSDRAPGTSPIHAGPLPRLYGVAVDDGASPPIVRYSPGDDLGWTRANLLSLPYRLRERARALIVGPGGGRDILVALGSGAAAVHAVERSPLVVRAVQDDLGGISGRPYSLPGVTGTVEEGRVFLARDASLYDVVQASAADDRFAPALVAFPFTTNPLYTREAFQAWLDRLAPDGILALSRSASEQSLPRLVATAREALEVRGVQDVPGSVFVAAGGGLTSVLVRNGPFTPAELEVLRLLCGELGFEVLFSPDRGGAGITAGLLLSPDLRTALDTLPIDAAPVDDDRPFFHSPLRPADLLRSRAANAPDLGSRGLLLGRNLLGAIALVLAFVALALAWRRSGREGEPPRGRSAAALGYFAATGLGFIMVEIGLLAHFLPLLGKPATTLAATLAVFLAAGAAGSFRSGPLEGSGRAVRRHCATLTIVLLFTVVLLPPALAGLLGTPLWARLAAAVAVAGPLGYLLGQPLPAGLSLLRRGRLVPLAWGANGAFAVLGSLGALALAVSFGVTVTLLVGPACCLVAGALAEVVE